jgi:hypothetical protein
MSPLTSPHNFRFPSLSDSPNVPRDIQALAVDIGAYIDANPGPQGIQGRQGTQGLTGAQGAIGLQGTTGLQGTIGAQGTTGTQGITGAQGTTGTQGAIGTQGVQGLANQGVQGTAGSVQGTQGLLGTQGAIGTQGIQGLANQGVQGIAGSVQGTQGIQGNLGVQGTEGTSGLAPIVTNAQTASYTAVLADAGKLVEISNASANNFTVPLNSSVSYAVGTQINILQTGAGQTTVVPTGGVTVNATPGLKLRAQWSSATLIKRATDTWVLVGDLSA